jgi:AcrR family transcriptional regulator
MGKKEDTHARIVEHASKALRASGYEGVSVADIMKEAGLTHGGFYAHFPSRDALVVEALEQATRQSVVNLEDAEDLAGLAERYLSDAHVKKPELGCALAALGSETRRQPTAVKKIASKNLAGFRKKLESLGLGEDAALVAVSALVGAVVLSRAVDDAKAGKEVRDAVRAFVTRGGKRR